MEEVTPLTLAGADTTMSKSLFALRVPSEAVTLVVMVPMSPAGGVPENVLVAGSKVSHDGRAGPGARVVEYVKVSPTSASANVSVPNVWVNAAPVAAVWLVRAEATVGASFTAAVSTFTCTGVADSEPKLSFATTVKAFSVPLASWAGVQKAR